MGLNAFLYMPLITVLAKEIEARSYWMSAGDYNHEVGSE